MARVQSLSSRLRQCGVSDIAKASNWFDEGAPLHAFATSDTFFHALGQSACPDSALLTFLLIKENCDKSSRQSTYRDICADKDALTRLFKLCGASRVLGEYLAHNLDLMSIVMAPTHTVHSARRIDDIDEPVPLIVDYDDDAERRDLEVWAMDIDAQIDTICQGGTMSASDNLRHAYYTVLLSIACEDVCDDQPLIRLTYTSRQLAYLTTTIIRRAYQMAKDQVDPDNLVDFAVIAMGKTAGEELNYISDVDLMYVCQTRGDIDERQAVALGTQIATSLHTICSGPGSVAPLWPIDTALRPEGKDGPLVRSVDSYMSYYDSWAQSWEFQALLKARFIAGDTALGNQFIDRVSPLVWNACRREDFVYDARKMRKRVEDHIPKKDVERQLKLGPGGLRDVEFSVQLLQMVHGRLDETLHTKNTCEAIDRLSNGSYISRTSAKILASCYRFLRLVEHRTQLYRLKRSHLIPSKDDDIRRVARGVMGPRYTSVEDFLAIWDSTRARVRRLHEELFYRPLLPATAQLSDEDATLSPQAQLERLAFIGYRDPEHAISHIEALTSGTNRTAQIQRHILPVLLGWFADGPDPDEGLLAFRRLSDMAGTTHWYMATLRDSRVVARRLSTVLSTSRYIGNALPSMPPAVQWLEEGGGLDARSTEFLDQQVSSVISRHDDSRSAVDRLMDIRRREMLRAAMGDVLDHVDPVRATTMINPINDAVIRGCINAVRDEYANQDVKLCAIAMGRYGGCEPSYASDADIVIVCDNNTDIARDIAIKLRELTGLCGDPQFRLKVDMDLRPEGRDGPLVRSFESYKAYYDSWASAWERQALIRARVVYADGDLGQRVNDVIDSVRYGKAPTDKELIEIRRLKARMEHERLPRGADPKWHVKLGQGGLSDVEWCVQLLQMRHSGDVEKESPLRTTGTLAAIEALVAEGFMTESDATVLKDSWVLASRIRAGNVLASGKVSGKKLDSVPRRADELKVVACLLGYDESDVHALEEDYRRASRRARTVMERLFYDM